MVFSAGGGVGRYHPLGPPERKAFGRGEWHYVNVPLFLSERTSGVGRQADGECRDRAAGRRKLDTPSMNVTQAINLGRRVVKDPQASPADRAVMLAWLFHCVGDIHQPLHGAAMFSVRLFPEGDRGGNSVKTKQNGNLHALWDGLLGRDEEFGLRKTPRSNSRPARNLVGSVKRRRRCSMKWRGTMKVTRSRLTAFIRPK